MKINWRLAMLGASAAAIAIAAAPEAAPPGKEVPVAGRAVATAPAGAARTKAAAKEKPVVKLDMDRLRRLQPAKADATPVATPAPAAEVVAGQEAPAKPELTNAFAAKSWYVPPPPPPPPKPEPPPKPMAPPLPFTYVGRYDNPEKPPVVLLLKADRLYTVSEGEAIEGTYRIDRIEKGRVELIYLPLHQRQVLQTGEPG